MSNSPEYTIYNESLVKYVIRNNLNGEYIFQGEDVDNEISDLTTYRLDKVVPLDTLEEAREYRDRLIEDLKEDDPEVAEAIQIRKIKVIDIGEIK